MLFDLASDANYKQTWFAAINLCYIRRIELPNVMESSNGCALGVFCLELLNNALKK